MRAGTAPVSRPGKLDIRAERIKRITIMPVISFKISEEQARELRRAARLKHKTVSEYLRDTAFPAAPFAPELIIKKHAVSGLSYNAAPGQLNPSPGEIRAVLADFP